MVTSRFRALISAFLIVGLMASSIYYIQGSEASQLATQKTARLLASAPTAPYWTYETGSSLWTVAVSADGGTLVAGDEDNTIYVFGKSSNRTLWNYTTGGGVCSVAISDDGNTIVAGSYDDTVYVFGRSSNATLWTYDTGGNVCSVGISADGNTIVAGSDDNSVYVFGRSGNSTLWTCETAGDVRGVAVSADGSTIVAGSYDNRIRAFDRSSNATLWNYTTKNDVYDVAVSADGNTIAAGGRDESIRVFNRSSNTPLWTYNTRRSVYGVAVSRDGTTISAGSVNHHLRVFARSNNTALIDYNTGYDVARSAAVSFDGSAIVCGNIGLVHSKVFFFKKTVGHVWNFTVGESIGVSVSGHGPSAAISSDGSVSAFAGYTGDGTLFVFLYDVVPPSLGSPSVSPSSPGIGQNISISISVTDNLGVSAVTLYYKNASVIPWNSTAMTLEGAVYEASIGPYNAVMNVSYYINATDISGNLACSPSNAPTGYHTILVGQSGTGFGGLDIMAIVIIAIVTVAVVAVLAVVLTRRGKEQK